MLDRNYVLIYNFTRERAHQSAHTSTFQVSILLAKQPRLGRCETKNDLQQFQHETMLAAAVDTSMVFDVSTVRICLEHHSWQHIDEITNITLNLCVFDKLNQPPTIIIRICSPNLYLDPPPKK